ncbi:MAG: ABC transporter permease [Fibrobacteria bacterium]|nr:ABC transporter permease [Fibrobacteria bacterium]
MNAWLRISGALASTLRWLGEAWEGQLPGQLLSLLWKVSTCLFHGRRATLRSIRDIFVQQVYFTGVEAVPIVLGLATLLGGVTIVQAATVLPRIGTSDFLGDVMVLVVLRELAPLFTGFLVAGRTGSALATFLGNMKVNNEVDALESMGIDPVRFLVLPALLGSTAAMVCLSLLFTSVALFGGYLVALGLAWAFPGVLGLEMSFLVFVSRTLDALAFLDLFVLILKPMAFGTVIALLACHNGLSLGISPHEVPQGTRRAVVQSFVAVVLLDGMFAAMFVVPQLAELMP